MKKAAQRRRKSCAVIHSPVREPSLSEEHKLWCEEESIRSGEDDRCGHGVLDAFHDHGCGYSDTFSAFRKLKPVLEA